LTRLSFHVPDGHLNYIDDAFRIYGSYGVPKERIFVTGNSPDTDTLFAARAEIEKLPPVLPPCEHRLIHVGRLVAWKRVDLLLRAHARIKKEFHDAELVVLGEGPEEAALRRLTKELGVEDSVRFVAGVYEPKHLGQYLMASSIYVLAGMGGLSINDAMCSGLPVICSECDGTEKVLVRDEFNGKVFRNGDEDDLVDKIRHLFSNPELRQQMGRHSTDIIRNEVNIHTVIARYVKAFEAITGRGLMPGER
jgi:glycosyltransferase involved in cell wall biosynthesis